MGVDERGDVGCGRGWNMVPNRAQLLPGGEHGVLEPAYFLNDILFFQTVFANVDLVALKNMSPSHGDASRDANTVEGNAHSDSPNLLATRSSKLAMACRSSGPLARISISAPL